MIEPALTFTDDPAQATPQQRADAIAAIFAAAILRMRPAITDHDTHQSTAPATSTVNTASVREKVSESVSNPLALLGDTSVTVTAG